MLFGRARNPRDDEFGVLTYEHRADGVDDRAAQERTESGPLVNENWVRIQDKTFSLASFFFFFFAYFVQI